MPIPRTSSRFFVELDEGFANVADVVVGIDPAGDGQADQLHGRRRIGKHNGAYLHGPDAELPEEGDDQGLPRELLPRDMGQKTGGIHIDGVASDGFDDGDSLFGEHIAEQPRLSGAKGEVVLLDDVFESLSHGFEVPTRKPPVGAEALVEDETVADGRKELPLLPEGNKAADIDEGIFFAPTWYNRRPGKKPRGLSPSQAYPSDPAPAD